MHLLYSLVFSKKPVCHPHFRPKKTAMSLPSPPASPPLDCSLLHIMKSCLSSQHRLLRTHGRRVLIALPPLEPFLLPRCAEFPTIGTLDSCRKHLAALQRTQRNLYPRLETGNHSLPAPNQKDKTKANFTGSGADVK